MTDPQAWLARGSLSGTVGPAGISFSASAYDRDHFDLPGDFKPTSQQPKGERINSDREDRSVQGNLVLAGEDNSLGVSLAYREGDYGKPPGTLSTSESDYATRPRFERVSFDTFSAQAAGDFAAGKSLAIKPTLYLSRERQQ